MSSLIHNKYKILQTLKQTPQKQIHRCLSHSCSTPLILKSYLLSSQSKYAQRQFQTYHKLSQPHHHGIPQVIQTFVQNGHVYIVMQELGDNLQDLRRRCGGRFTLKCVCMIGLQLIDRIQFVHNQGILHGDIKPSNVMVGKHKNVKHKIYLGDFEFSASFLTSKGKHIQQQPQQAFNGSLRFCPRAANQQLSFSRKDQLQSFIYTLIFLLKGQLPWSHIHAQTINEANEEVAILKKNGKEEMLMGLPMVFREIMGYIQGVKFEGKPQYGKIKKGFSQLMKKNGYQLDYKYDWEYL